MMETYNFQQQKNHGTNIDILVNLYTEFTPVQKFRRRKKTKIKNCFGFIYFS